MFTVRGAVNAAHHIRLSALTASFNPSCVITPPLAVGAGYVNAALLLIRPAVPLLTFVLPALCLPLHAARLEAIDARV